MVEHTQIYRRNMPETPWISPNTAVNQTSRIMQTHILFIWDVIVLKYIKQ